MLFLAASSYHWPHLYHCSWYVEPSLKFFLDDLFCRIYRLLGNDVYVSFDSHRKNHFLPFINLQELVNTTINFLKGVVKVWCLFFKEGDKNNSVIVERIGSNLEEGLPKVFIYCQHFSKFEHPIFNANLFQVLESIKSEASYLVEVIKVNEFELLLKDPHNLFLR